MPILVFLGLSVLDLGPMYATDRRRTDRQTLDADHRLMPQPYEGGGIIITCIYYVCCMQTGLNIVSLSIRTLTLFDAQQRNLAQ